MRARLHEVVGYKRDTAYYGIHLGPNTDIIVWHAIRWEVSRIVYEPLRDENGFWTVMLKRQVEDDAHG